MHASDQPAAGGPSTPEGSSAPGRPAAGTPGPKRRVGRPRRSEGPAVTREQIVREALRALMAHGITGLVLRDVARRLGVSLPTLQQHFPTKDDLYRACIDEITASVPVSPNSGLSESVDSATPLLSNFIRHQIERTMNYPRATAAMWNDNERGGPERLRYLYDRLSPVLAVARQNLEAAIAVGVFRPIDPDVFLALMSIGISSIASSRYPLEQMFGVDLDDEAARQRFVEALTDIVLYGVVAP